MSARIRKATEEDVEKISEIEAAGAAIWSREQIAAELKLNFANVLVVEQDEKIIGFAASWYVADEIQLNSIGILPAYRKQGLGTKLLDRVVSDSHERIHRPGRIVLEVNIENVAALQFYKKYGFVETGRRKNYYRGSDALLMIKELMP